MPSADSGSGAEAAGAQQGFWHPPTPAKAVQPGAASLPAPGVETTFDCWMAVLGMETDAPPSPSTAAAADATPLPPPPPTSAISITVAPTLQTSEVRP